MVVVVVVAGGGEQGNIGSDEPWDANAAHSDNGESNNSSKTYGS